MARCSPPPEAPEYPPKRILICHLPGTADAEVITIWRNEWLSHERHGDQFIRSEEQYDNCVPPGEELPRPNGDDQDSQVEKFIWVDPNNYTYCLIPNHLQLSWFDDQGENKVYAVRSVALNAQLLGAEARVIVEAKVLKGVLLTGNVEVNGLDGEIVSDDTYLEIFDPETNQTIGQVYVWKLDLKSEDVGDPDDIPFARCPLEH